MSKTADADYEPDANDYAGQVRGNDPAYITHNEKGRRAGTSGGPQVVADERTDQGMVGMSRKKADSDAQLQKDEKEAIDTSNIIDERTRGATKKKGTYREPGDEEGLPGRGDTGSSSLRTEGKYNV